MFQIVFKCHACTSLVPRFLVVPFNHGENVVTLEKFVQEQAPFLRPFRLHVAIRFAICMDKIKCLAMRVTFSLVLRIQEPLFPDFIDDMQFMKQFVEPRGTHAIIFSNGRRCDGSFAGKNAVGIIGLWFQFTDYLFCAGRFQFGVFPCFSFSF